MKLLLLAALLLSGCASPAPVWHAYELRIGLVRHGENAVVDGERGSPLVYRHPLEGIEAGAFSRKLCRRCVDAEDFELVEEVILDVPVVQHNVKVPADAGVFVHRVS